MTRSACAFAAAAAICAVVGGGAALWAQTPGDQEVSPVQETESAPAETTEPERLREGEKLVDQRGVFLLSEGRWSMEFAETGRRLTVLENLNLERIQTALVETPESAEWSVDGTVTEFEGRNFLLIQRATLLTRPPGEALTDAL